MGKFQILILTYLLINSAFLPNKAQAALPENSVNIELLGAGLIYSVNYERVFADSVGLRIGMGGLSQTSNSADVFVGFFPVSLNFLGLRSGSHMLEIGLGGTYTFFSVEDYRYDELVAIGAGITPLGTIGYRYQADLLQMLFPVQFRIGVNSFPAIEGLPIWPYLSFGMGF